MKILFVQYTIKNRDLKSRQIYIIEDVIKTMKRKTFIRIVLLLIIFLLGFSLSYGRYDFPNITLNLTEKINSVNNLLKDDLKLLNGT